MRKKFDKSLEIDAGRRNEIAKKIKREEEAGAEALAQFEALFEERQGWERPSRSFGLADSKVQASETGGKVWGCSNVSVRAEMEEIAGFFGTLAAAPTCHGGHHRDCTFASEMALQRADSDTIIVLVAPLSGKDKYGRATVVIRGSVAGVGNIVAIETKETVVIWLRRLIPLEEYGVEDGIALAHDLLWMASSGKKRAERAKEVLKESRAMRELTETLPWFETMLTIAVEGDLHRNIPITTKLVCVSEKEAIRIGKNLMPALKGKKLITAE
ncbi:hypothetical protein TrLO_g15473 [Triparma laevis f. longispina]|uniref:Uncharacterized protein n=1 Tax=Triparma laevis f. longispina TaxID=1714387 RepID=A0A9W7CDD3_9STRA|nr:hypothetical protein TrLO_g15473 [Triparma laevis f. longispina]